MNEQEVQKQLEEQNELLQKIYASTEKTRKYFLWTLILSIIFFIFPLFGIFLIAPSFLHTVTGGGI
ncbi:MAG: hypothetical protein AAB796_00545 [Patescibacteria group bacterium]